MANNLIDVWNYVHFEEDPEEYGERIYIDVYALATAAESIIEEEIQKDYNKEYKDHSVELTGVKRWEH
jgi:hypothetical protein